jgi:hypothetical protein
MGTIISSRVLPDRTLRCRILLEKEEALFLAGAMRDIHLFSDELCNERAAVMEKGEGGVTKYFEIPKRLRMKRGALTSCMRFDTASKAFFIYVLDLS